MKQISHFSGSTLKIIACIFMLIDHIGVRIFPTIIDFRIIGRLAFPIFAYFIAEGCKYTKNKIKRLITIIIFAVLCEIPYLLYSGRHYGNILFTFSLSVILIYTIQYAKKMLHKKQIISAFISVAVVSSFVYITTRFIGVDYGFYGVLVPVFVSLSDYKENETPEFFKKLDNRFVKLLLFAFALLMLSVKNGINYL